MQTSLPRTAGITSPDKFFGFQMGADKQDGALGQDGRVLQAAREGEPEDQGRQHGPDDDGQSVPAASSSRRRRTSRSSSRFGRSTCKLSDPRGIAEAEITQARRRGQGRRRPVDEHARDRDRRQPDGAGAGLRSARRAPTRRPQRILDNVDLPSMVPCFNPDGQIMVTDWYNKTLGTQSEGVELPVALPEVRRPRQQPRRVP